MTSSRPSRGVQGVPGGLPGGRPPGQAPPDRPSLDGLEDIWVRRWEEQGTYRFDRTATRDRVYSIDTPPPTVSGVLHVGSAFSYTHTDVIARFQRMRGKAVFYPMGWDDNGLPTERRVQNHFGVRCDPSLRYDPSLDQQGPPGPQGSLPLSPAPDPTRGSAQGRVRPDPARPVPISRRAFIELCGQLTAADEKAFEEVWRRVGLSVDWSLTYATIDTVSRAAAQRAFLRNLARGEAYLAEAPGLWDVTFGTAVAQAELEDRDWPGAWHRITFRGPDGDSIFVETTRPELLPACVALIAHPDDERYRQSFGMTATVPLFGVEVPILAHEAAEPDRGTGIAMCCTFGDLTDVQWWRELRLPAAAGHRQGWADPGRPAALARARGGTPRICGACRPQRRRGTGAGCRAAARSRSPGWRAAPGRPPGQVLREGRAAAGDRHEQAVVSAQRRARPGSACRAARPRA